MNTEKAYAERIAGEYAVGETRKVVALKKLDRRAKRPARVFGYLFGTVMALTLGVGMCLSMKVIGDGSRATMIYGALIGTAGIFGMTVNYPLSRKILEHSKKKYSADVLALAEQIAAE